MEGEPVNENEFEELARQVLPKMYSDFFAGGDEDQYTLEENIEAFRRIIIRPRIPVDVSRIDMSTIILGHKTSTPIVVAPTMMPKFAHPEGEVATARGAASCNITAVIFSLEKGTISNSGVWTGVKQVIEMLKNELEQTMALAGCCTVDDTTRNYVKTDKETFLRRM